jgi:hypothetical protein
MQQATKEKTLHNTIRDQVTEDYRKKGFTVTTEKTIGNRRVDVFAVKGEEMYIIEVVDTHYSGAINDKLLTQLKVSVPKPSELAPPEVWTAEDEAVYGPLRRKKLRIERRKRLDATGQRKKKFGVRPNRRGVPPTGKIKDK